MSLGRSSAVVGGWTFLSRVLGMVRDIVLARLFGAGSGLDAFLVALQIPNFCRRLFAEGAFAATFVPLLSEYKTRHGEAEVRTLAGAVAGTFGAILLGCTALGILAAPVVVTLLAPGFLAHPSQHELAVNLLRLMLPYALFIFLTGLAGALLNAYGCYAVPAITPTLLNLTLIGSAVWLAPRCEQPITALAWGVTLGGVLQLALQWPALRALRLWPRPRWAWHHAGVQRLRTLMMPAMLATSITQITLLLDTVLASWLTPGSVSWLYFSARLLEFPLGLLGIALGAAILPRLAQQYTVGTPADYARTLHWALRWSVLIGLPASLALIVLAEPIIITLYHYGAYTARDVAMSSQSLAAYAIGLQAFVMLKILTPAFLARNDTQTPLRLGLTALAIDIGLKLILMGPLGHAGLALASSLAAVLNVVLLWRALQRAQVLSYHAGWGKLLLQTVLAGAAMSGLLWLGAAADSAAWSALTGPARVFKLTLWCSLGAGGYFAVLWIIGVRYRNFRAP